MRHVFLRCASVFALCLAWALPADAATYTWTGATDGNFGTATNWSPSYSSPGTAYHDFIFNNNTNTTIATGAVRRFNSLDFQAGAGSFVFDGLENQYFGYNSNSTVTIQSGVTSNITFQATGTATYGFGATVVNSSGSHVFTNNGTGTLLFNTQFYTFGGTDSIDLGGTGNVSMSAAGVLNRRNGGNLSFTKSGNGTMSVTGGNFGGVNTGFSITGGTLSASGTLVIPAGGINVGSGATLASTFNGTPLTVTGGFVNNGAVDISPSSSIAQSLTPAISGSGSLTYNGVVNGYLNPTATLTYSGDTVINSGIIYMAGVGNLSPNSRMVVNSTGRLDLANRTQTVKGLSGNGTVYSFGGTTANGLVIDFTLGTETFTGVIGTTYPALRLTKNGDGVQVLDGANVYTGPTFVNDGSLIFNGNNTGTGAISVATGALLGGGGTLRGLVTTAGTTSILSPGDSSAGTLNLLAGLDVANGTTFQFALGTTSDLLNLGTSTLTAGAGSLLFDFTNAGGLTVSTPYTLLTFNSSSGLDYSDLIANSLPSGYSLDPSFGTGGWQINGTNLSVQFVPEPTSLVLGGVGAVGLVYVARRRRRTA